MANQIVRFSGKYDFLSNFYLSIVTLGELDFQTVEHAFQAAKTFKLDERRTIQQAESPAKAKHLGRQLTLRDDWESVKFGIMESLVRQKFTRYPELGQLLLATGEAELIEGNTWNDRTWGMTQDKHGTYIGKNWLGVILMTVRAEALRR